MSLRSTFRRLVPWLAAVVLLNLIVVGALTRASFLRRELRVVVDRSRAVATVGGTVCEAPIEAAGWHRLEVAAESRRYKTGAHFAVYPNLRLTGIRVDGREIPVGRDRFPAAGPVRRQAMRAVMLRALNRPIPVNDEVIEGSGSIPLDAAGRLELEATIAHPAPVFLDVDLKLVAETRRLTLRMSSDGSLSWIERQVDGSSRVVGRTAVDLFEPKRKHQRARVLQLVLGMLADGYMVLVDWLRWTVVAVAGLALIGLIPRMMGRARRRPPAARPGEDTAAAGSAGLPAGQPRSGSQLRQRIEAAAVGAMVVTAILSSVLISHVYYGGSPHVQDEVGYVAAARALGHGGLGFIVPKEATTAFEIEDFLWAGHRRPDELWPYYRGTFQIGYPLALALPARYGAEWLVNPVLGGILLLLLYLTARRHFGTSVALVASLLFLVSAFSRATAASLMATTATGLLVAAAAASAVRAFETGRRAPAVACGLCLGAIVNCRIYDGTVAAVGVGVCAVAFLLSSPLRSWLKTAAFIVAGGLPMVVLLLWQSAVLDLFHHATTSRNVTTLFVGGSIGAMWDRLLALESLLIGWKSLSAVGFLMLGVLLLPTRKSHWMVVLWAALFPIGYLVIRWHGVIYGPRYWYPSLAAMLLLMAITMGRMAGWSRRLAKLVWPHRHGPASAVPVASGILVVLLVVAPLFYETFRYGYQRGEFTPSYNNFNLDYRSFLAPYGLDNAIVFVGSSLEWQRRYLALGDNSRHDYRGHVLYATYNKHHFWNLRRAYPERTPFVLVEDDRRRLALYRIEGDEPLSEPRFERMPERGRSPGVVMPTNAFEGLPPGDKRKLAGDLALTPNGGFVSAARDLRHVFRWEADGRMLRMLGPSFVEGPGGLESPLWVDVDPNGVVHIYDEVAIAVLRFRLDGEFLGRWGETEVDTPIEMVLGVVGLDDGSTVLIRKEQRDLLRIGPEGEASRYLSEHGIGEPWGICRSPDGRLFVWDRETLQLISFTPDGRWIGSIPVPLPEQSLRGTGLSMAADDHRVVIADHFSSSFAVVTPAEGSITHVGSFDLSALPEGVAVRGDSIYFMSLEENRMMSLPLPD